ERHECHDQRHRDRHHAQDQDGHRQRAHRPVSMASGGGEVNLVACEGLVFIDFPEPASLYCRGRAPADRLRWGCPRLFPPKPPSGSHAAATRPLTWAEAAIASSDSIAPGRKPRASASSSSSTRARSPRWTSWSCTRATTSAWTPSASPATAWGEVPGACTAGPF